VEDKEFDDMMREFLQRNQTLMLDVEKFKIVNNIYKQICELLNNNKSVYSIDFIIEPLLKRNVAIVVITDKLEVAGINNMNMYINAISNLIEISHHGTNDGKIKMYFVVKEVFIEIDAY